MRRSWYPFKTKCRAETETDSENRLVVVKGEGVGEGWIGSLGLADANYYI